MDYGEAIEVLERSNEKFEFSIHWGVDLQSELGTIRPADDARQRCRPRPASGAKNASIRSNPIPPRWLLGTAPKRPCSIGVSGWSAPAAVAGRTIWW